MTIRLEIDDDGTAYVIDANGDSIASGKVDLGDSIRLDSVLSNAVLKAIAGANNRLERGESEAEPEPTVQETQAGNMARVIEEAMERIERMDERLKILEHIHDDV